MADDKKEIPSRNARRGFVPEDMRQFTEEMLEKLKEAAQDTRYLLNRGYAVKDATTFVGNHFCLSERQRMALARSISSDADVENRRKKECACREVHIDGFNTIITLEVALSHSPLLQCMDGTIRDLAGLRGTYRIIDETRTAIHLIFRELTGKMLRRFTFIWTRPCQIREGSRPWSMKWQRSTPWMLTSL